MGSEEAPHPGGGRWVSGRALHKVLVQLFTLGWYMTGCAGQSEGAGRCGGSSCCKNDWFGWPLVCIVSVLRKDTRERKVMSN